MGAKINRHEYKKQDVYMVSEYLPLKYLLVTEGEIVTSQRRNLSDTT